MLNVDEISDILKSPTGTIPTNSRDISNDLLMDNGKMKLHEATFYSQYSPNELRLFCHKHARYGIPTHETINFLSHKIDGRTAIEIGAGAGDFGYHLRIPMTDRKLQEEELIKESYSIMGQPLIQYPADVEKMEAMEAVRHYAPKVVIGSWVTTYGNPNKNKYGCNLWGVHEETLLRQVEMFILIGNLDVHRRKPIMKLKHQEYDAPWIISRAQNPENNRIFVWDNCK